MKLALPQLLPHALRRTLSALSRPALAAGSAAWGVLAIVYFVLAYRIVFVLRIGPTAVVVDDSAGWGVHTGDLLALPVSLAGLVCVALSISWVHRAATARPPLVVRPRQVQVAAA